MPRYTFGDDDPAVQRLALVAEAYAPVSRAFLERHARADTMRAVDLGCGPGFSTELIATTCAPRTLVGLDSSASFLDVARQRVPTARFEQHDVSVVPFPEAMPDLTYARLLLAHLPDPPAILERWRQQLAPGGVLLSEELEDIDAPAGPLRDYDVVSAEIVRQAGGVMYAGPLLASLGGACRRITTSAAMAARIYAFNVRRWRERGDSGVVDAHLAELELGLADVVRREDARELSWIVRQSVVRA